MKTVIVYRSFLGSTKKYATWLADSLGADRYTFSQGNETLLKSYDTVIVMSGTYAAKMPLISYLNKFWYILKQKHVVVVAVGIAPPGVEQSKISYESIPVEIRSHITYFKLPGSLLGIAPLGRPDEKFIKPVIVSIKSMS
jgi:menaquinone-dependent protoporphyrinogen IX oxidase